MIYTATDRRTSTRAERNAEYEDRGEPRKKFWPPNYAFVAIAVIVTAINGGLGAYSYRQAHREQSVAVGSNIWTTSNGTAGAGTVGAVFATVSYGYDDSILREITTGPKFDKFQQAIAAWTKAVGPLGFTPTLIAGSQLTCGGFAIACVHGDGGKQVFLANATPDIDLTTVFMHEIGHLLNVPHIEGDGLMDATYQGTVRSPTISAILLAGIHRKHGEAKPPAPQ